MAQKNEAPILIVALLLTVGLLGGGAWWLFNQLSGGRPEQPGSSTSLPTTGTDGTSQIPVQERLSLGDRLLLPQGASADKQAGVAAIASGDYAQAIERFGASLAANRNDPEALIYLNNARIGTQPAYTIAVAVPASAAIDSTQEILRGVAQAQNEVNRSGGIQGVPLQILLVDDGDDETVAQQVAQALAADPQVLGVVGHFSSNITLTVADIYAQQQLVMISPTSTSVQFSQAGDYAFRTVQSDRIAADGLARYMVDSMAVQNVAIFYNSQSDYSLSLKDAFTSAILTGGGQVVTEFDLAGSNFNALSAVDQAIQQGSGALMLAANTATRDAALQVIAANRQRLKLLGGDSLYNAEILQIGGASAVGMVIAAPWHRDANPNSPFPNAARQLWGGDVSWRTALSYDATQVLIAALRQNPTRAGIQQALSTPGFSVNGASGSIQFLPSGDRNRPTQLVVIEPGSQSGYGYDFVPVP